MSPNFAIVDPEEEDILAHTLSSNKSIRMFSLSADLRDYLKSLKEQLIMQLV